MLHRMAQLSIGATASAVVNAAIYPALARYYEPAHIGVLGFYFSTTQLLAAVIGLRYEQAIALRANIVSKARAAVTALTIGAVVAILIFTGSIALKGYLDRLFSVNLGWFWALAPANSFAVFCSVILTQLLIANRLEKRVAISRNVKALSAGCVQIGMAMLFSPMAILLIIGEFVGAMLGLFVAALGMRSQWHGAPLAQIQSRRYISTFARVYRSQPVWNLPQTLINSATGVIVLSSIAVKYDAFMAGSYFLMYRILMLPSGLIAAPMAQIFMHEASAEIRRRGNFFKSMLVLIATQSVVALIIIPPVTIFGPTLFSLFLGEKWRVAGELASAFAPYIALHLILSAAGNCTILANQQKPMLFVAFVQNMAFALPFVLIPASHGLVSSITSMLYFSVPYMGTMVIWYIYLSRSGRKFASRR